MTRKEDNIDCTSIGVCFEYYREGKSVCLTCDFNRLRERGDSIFEIKK